MLTESGQCEPGIDTMSVQVIYALFSAVPPSLWFSPDRPLVFGVMVILVLGLSIAAATLYKHLLSIAMTAVHSGAAREPHSPKQESPKLLEAAASQELIEMHARAAEIHSPLSPVSAMSA